MVHVAATFGPNGNEASGRPYRVERPGDRQPRQRIAEVQMSVCSVQPGGSPVSLTT